MGANPLRAWVLAATVIISAQAVSGQISLHGFSPTAVESIPDIVRRANSPELDDRIGVLDQLLIKGVRSDVLRFTYAYDLPREDYLSVVRSVLEGGLLLVQDRDRVGTVLLKISQVAIDVRLVELLPEMAALLKSEHLYAQIAAMRVLDRLGSEQYVGEIAQVALSSNPDVRQPAVEILLKSSSREAVPALISCLKDDNFGIQMRAIEALRRIGDRSVIPDLVPLLKTRLATWAIRALVQLDAREAVPYIKELYRPGEANAKDVLISLAYFGDEQAISDVVAQMTDANQPIGESLLESLIRVRARAVIPALISGLKAEKALGGQSSRGRNIVCYMMMALARLDAREAVPVLQRYLNLAFDRALREPNAFLASSAIEALGVLRAREVIPELMRILDVDDYSFRRGAQIALARIGEPNTAASVITSLKTHMSSSNHVEVLEELANISDPNTYQALLRTELPSIESSPSEEYLRQLTEKSGVKFTFTERIPLPDEKKQQGIAALSIPMAIDALRRVVGTLNYSSADYAVFIHDRVVYVVTVEEAYELWDGWLAEHVKNHPAPAS